jgi:hypothetical protein
MWARFSAGAVLGLPLAFLSTGLVSFLWPTGWDRVIVPVLLLSVPMWVGIMAGSVMFRSARRAWLILAGLNVLTVLLLWGARHALA